MRRWTIALQGGFRDRPLGFLRTGGGHASRASMFQIEVLTHLPLS